MTNPFTEKTRSRIYVAGIIVGALAAVVGPLATALGLGEAWLAVLTSAIGAFTVLTSTLSKANLSTDDDPTGALTDSE